MNSIQETHILSALADLDRGIFKSLRAAAAAYNVPLTTLSRRRNGTAKSRREVASSQQILSVVQEDLIEAWILDCEAAQHPVTHANCANLPRYIAGMLEALRLSVKIGRIVSYAVTLTSVQRSGEASMLNALRILLLKL